MWESQGKQCHEKKPGQNAGEHQHPCENLWHYNELDQWSPTFLEPGASFIEDNFSMDLWAGGSVMGVCVCCRAQVVMCGLFPHRAWTGHRLRPGCWGPQSSIVLRTFCYHIYMEGRKRRALKENQKGWLWRKEKHQERVLFWKTRRSFKEFHSFITLPSTLQHH